MKQKQKLWLRPKKVVLFPEIGRLKIFLSPTCPHMSNVNENIYFLIQKNTRKQKISTSKCIQIYVFSFQTIKHRALCFSTKKTVVRVVFKSRFYLKNSIKYIYTFFCGRPGKDFLSPAFPGNKGIIFFRPTMRK